MGAGLTAVILTKNEELNIAECINSIKAITKRIIIVDSYSEDKTIEIAKKLGAEIYENSFINYATQFKWALNNTGIETNWVLRIDADERLLPETLLEVDEMMKIHENDNVNGLIFKTRICFMGRWIKHGGIYPLKILRIFKYGKADIENRKMDEHLILLSGKTIELKNDLLHFDFKNLNYWISKHNWYATREALDYFDIINEMELNKTCNFQAKIKRYIKYKIYYKIPLFLRPFLYFSYRYILLLGFLDGKEGLIFHFLQGFWYRFLVDAKIYECKKNGKIYDETRDLKT